MICRNRKRRLWRWLSAKKQERERPVVFVVMLMVQRTNYGGHSEWRAHFNDCTIEDPINPLRIVFGHGKYLAGWWPPPRRCSNNQSRINLWTTKLNCQWISGGFGQQKIDPSLAYTYSSPVNDSATRQANRFNSPTWTTTGQKLSTDSQWRGGGWGCGFPLRGVYHDHHPRNNENQMEY